MKRIYKMALLLLVIPLWSACSDESEAEGTENILFDGIAVQTGERTAGTEVSTRAGEGFAVNTANDPTYETTRLNGGGGADVGTWTLTATIYDKNNDPYPDANGTWVYQTNKWVPTGGTTLYLPSYFSPRVTANLFPSDKTATDLPELDQNTKLKLLRQDLLVQRSVPYSVTPAHVMKVKLRHQYSMLDIILDGVNTDDIDQVRIIAGGQTYIPYNITAIPNEYLVILPTGISKPQIVVRTKKGAEYTETLNITSTTINYAYCIKLTGVELIVSSVTVIDWTYGTALSGQYTTPTSYPTFRGNPNTTITIVYDNGLSQLLTFNAQGESVAEKPLGRTIVKVGDNELSPPVILDEMYVDLRPYMAIP